jgi:hypothetical protein
VVQAVADADGVDQLVEPGVVDAAAGDRERQQDVLARVEDRQQVEGLEDEADPLAPQQRQRAVVERPSSTPSSVTVPLVGRSRPARMCISVDLPDPDGPMIAAKRAGAKSTLTSRSASTATSPSP